MNGRQGAAAPNQWITRLSPPVTTLRFNEGAQTCPVSVVILAKDEERCIARCIDSVAGHGLDDIVVVDTGSTDKTQDIVDGYWHRGVRLVRWPWSNSFAEARNFAIDTVASGWIVFLDADEWLTERSAQQLKPCLAELTHIAGLSGLVFAPEIVHVDRDECTNDVARIFKADSAIRFQGRVHEYPVLTGEPDRPVGMVGVNLEFRHDGYGRSVTISKNKRQRNLALLNAARADDPDNPRWWYFTIRDGLPVHSHARLVDMCETVRGLANGRTAAGDPRSAREYCRLALGSACQALAAMGDWPAVHRYCADLPLVDAFYFRAMPDVLGGAVTKRDFLQAVKLRSDDDRVPESVLDSSGRHLDAMIIALLERVRGEADAERYRALCDPWSDAFFDNSRLRSSLWHSG
jgi:hypothetical protein